MKLKSLIHFSSAETERDHKIERAKTDWNRARPHRRDLAIAPHCRNLIASPFLSGPSASCSSDYRDFNPK